MPIMLLSQTPFTHMDGLKNCSLENLSTNNHDLNENSNKRTESVNLESKNINENLKKQRRNPKIRGAKKSSFSDVNADKRE